VSLCCYADSCDDDPDDSEVGIGTQDAVVPGNDDDDIASDEPTADLDAVCRSHRLPGHILHLKRLDVETTPATALSDVTGIFGVHSISTVLRGSQFGPFDCWIVDEQKAGRQRHRQIVDDCDGEKTFDWTLQVHKNRLLILYVHLDALLLNINSKGSNN
jgi:hypothetical protein